jgi:NAD(P)H-hydrate epimerase
VLKYDAIGIGPGLGTEDETRDALRQILKACNKPVVLDADGLNIVAYNAEMLKYIPPFSIISPHPREFERLFGKSPDDFERLELARIKATELQLIIILKGHHTAVCIPGGRCSFNTTGNSGMATGGSGDVLTGILTSLLAQGYSAEDAALLGVYLHGLAGDFAANRRSQEAMVASDITEQLGEAFKSIQSSLGSLTAKNVG